MAEPVLILEPGDERAQKIAKAMGSQTAGEILRLLGENQKSLTDIADRLALPMNTVKYHLGNLLDAGLISVADTRYSVKGREIKIYSLTNQLLIVAPRQSDVRSLLLKYGVSFRYCRGCLSRGRGHPAPAWRDRERSRCCARRSRSGTGGSCSGIENELGGGGRSGSRHHGSGPRLLSWRGSRDRSPALLRSLALEETEVKKPEPGK